ncbi:MAG: GGDEF domain-containing protein [Bdellovibrionales bacterium]
MKHDDFTTLEIDEVLTKVLNYCQSETKAAAVHWASAYGLTRVRDCEEENWQWAFASADVVGHHMWSQPATDLFSLFQLWRQVDRVYPLPWQKSLSPHVLTSPQPLFLYPVYFNRALIGILVFERPREANPVALMNQFKPAVDLAARYLAFAYQHLEVKNQSYLDELTGLYNQRYLPLALEHEIQHSKRENTPFCLLFLDIDYFKMVNDGRGHWVGSRLLVELGKVLKSQVRTVDYCFRYGGDEFIVLLGRAGLEDSKRVAERIRKAIEGSTFTVEGHSLNLTVSIGLASYPDHAQTAPGLIQIADQAMYYGKRKSRNIVFVAS